MVKSVEKAFDIFFENQIYLPKNINYIAKNSRKFLIDQIHLLSSQCDFVKLSSEFDLSFGSFARKTKITPLDDIDIIIGIDGTSTFCFEKAWNNMVIEYVKIHKNNMLERVCDTIIKENEIKHFINSTKLKNRLVSALKKIPQYERADIHGKGETVTLKLNCYEWTFDIVLAFKCTDGDSEYYLIPNGKGGWKKTNPKIEHERLLSLNKRFNGKVIQLIRLVKYWNKNGKMPTITSFVLETIVLDYFSKSKHSWKGKNETIDIVYMHFKWFLYYLSINIFKEIKDSKGIQGNLNYLRKYERLKIANRALEDFNKAKKAIVEQIYNKNIKKSINLWREIFGKEFPQYDD